MKMTVSKILLVSFLLVCMVFCFAACDMDIGALPGDNGEVPGENEENPPAKVVYSLVLIADKTEAARGEVIALSAVLRAENEEDTPSEDAVFSITEGSDYATLVGSTLTVKGTAPDGAVIKVKAREGATDSNVVEIKVSVPAESIVISADGVTNILAGQSVVLDKTILPEGAASNAEWTITEGEDIAKMSGDVLIVNANAPTGATVKVKAVVGELESNELSFTVGYPLTSLSAQLIGSANLSAGATAQLVVVPNPENATNASYSWVFVEGEEYVTLAGDYLTVKADAALGATVKLKAVAGDIESNVISIVVGIPIESITISSTAPEILDRGGMYPITLVPNPTNASLDAIAWNVSEGGEWVSVNSGFITVAQNTPAGTKVKIIATSGSIVSNELSFTVGVALESIKIELGGSANVDPEGTRVITSTLEPANASDTAIEWVFVSGADYCTIVNGVIIVNKDAPVAAKIELYAKIGDVVSNSISIVVGTPIKNIAISADKDSIVKGESANLTATVIPADVPASLAEWIIVEGAEYATITDSVLYVNADAPTDAVIKVKAVSGSVESNVLEFIVDPTLAESYLIDLSADSIKLDKKGNTAPILTAEVYNGLYEKIDGAELEFTVIDGAQYLAISQNGKTCAFTPLGHGTATIAVTLVGTTIVETATVNVIVPPDAVDLPEVFKERPNFEYKFSMIDHETGKYETLPFVPSVRGSELSCKDYTLTFINTTNGESGSGVAVYENGEITFKQRGLINVIVSSASGSNVEAVATYKFEINEGYNVSTFAELQQLLNNSKYSGQEINVVVLEKPVGQTGYEYGYDIVPPVALLSHSEQTIEYILKGVPGSGTHSNRLQAVNKSVWLNGNMHKIDASQIRVYSEAEAEAYRESIGASSKDTYIAIGSLLSAEPWSNQGITDMSVQNKVYDVRYYDIEIVGNAPIDYDPTLYSKDVTGDAFRGAYRVGINVGTAGYAVRYTIDSENLTVSGFHNGMDFLGLVDNGSVRNLHAYNCYSTGIVVKESIATFENLKFGPCGATGMEIVPDRDLPNGQAGRAGREFNQAQQITFSGILDASTNLNDGTTNYYKNYTIMGATVPMIINANVSAIHSAYGPLGDIAVSHIRNENGQFNFVSLVFNELGTLPVVGENKAIITYPEYLDGGIVAVEDLPKDGTVDTNHQFIKMTVYVEIPGLGTISAGTALFYNHHFKQK